MSLLRAAGWAAQRTYSPRPNRALETSLSIGLAHAGDALNHPLG